MLRKWMKELVEGPSGSHHCCIYFFLVFLSRDGLLTLNWVNSPDKFTQVLLTDANIRNREQNLHNTMVPLTVYNYIKQINLVKTIGFEAWIIWIAFLKGGHKFNCTLKWSCYKITIFLFFFFSNQWLISWAIETLKS